MDIIDQLKLMEAGKVTVFPCDQTIVAARETIERLRAENAHYVQALAEAIMLFDYAQSGFISGCGEDLAWEKRKDEWLARVQAHEQGENTK